MYSSRMMRGAFLCMAWCLFCFILPDVVMNERSSHVYVLDNAWSLLVCLPISS